MEQAILLNDVAPDSRDWGQIMTLEQIYNLPTPDATDTWKPVPHGDIITEITSQLDHSNYQVAHQEYLVANKGKRLFGTLTLEDKINPEVTMALGVRNSHDKRMSFGMAVGGLVIVCSNMMFAGDVIYTRKHTSGINITESVRDIFTQLPDRFEQLEKNYERLKMEGISSSEAEHFVIQAAREGAIPSCDIVPVLDEFLSPSFPDFEDQTKMNLHNSFTHIAKKYTLQRKARTDAILGQMFGI